MSEALDREAVSEYLVVVIARDSAEISQEVHPTSALLLYIHDHGLENKWPVDIAKMQSEGIANECLLFD